jgi:hypothetical protein
MKIVFGPKEDAVHLHPKDGEFITSCSAATIHYCFERGYNYVDLTIGNQALQPKDLDDLIDFLKAAKEQLK